MRTEQRRAKRSLVIRGILVLVTTLGWSVACSDARDATPTEPSLDWDQIRVGTGPGIPGIDYPEDCDTLLTENFVDSCDWMPAGTKDSILDAFNDSTFRSEDLECEDLKTVLTDVMDTNTKRARGTHSSTRGVARWNVSTEERKLVWFWEALMSMDDTARQRIVAHEAYHLAEFSGDNAAADTAGLYCFNRTETSPWGPE